MTWETMETRYLDERGAEILDIPLTDEDGADLAPGSVAALTASLYHHQDAAFVFEQRDVKASLTTGTLALALSSDDLARRTAREVETLSLTISIRYATSKERHLTIPCQLRRVVGAYDMTP